jgi:hypothetical protein
MRKNVLHELSQARLRALLLVPTEESTIDFKEALSLFTSRGAIEFAKDVLAFANSGGGHMVVGVADGQPRRVVGISNAELAVLTEPKRVNDAIHKYTGGLITVSVAVHDLAPGEHAPVAIVYVPGRSKKVPAQMDGVYSEPGPLNKQKFVFHKGDVYIRKGDQSCKVETPDDLVAKIPVQRYALVAAAELQDTPNPYGIASAATNQMFKGRDLEIEMLLDSIETGAHTAVFGLQRIGKTSLVQEVLKDRLALRPRLKDQVLFAVLDFQNLGNEYTYRSFLESLVHAVANNVPNVSLKDVSNQIAAFASQYARGSKKEMLVGFSTLLEKLAARSRKRIVIFLDEFSELCRAIERNEQRAARPDRIPPSLHPHELPVDVDLMHWFSALIKSEGIKGRIVFVFAVRPFVADYDKLRNLQILKLTKSITLYHLDAAAARALVTEPLRGTINFAPDAIDYVCSLTAGHPYLLQMFLRDLVDRLKRERRQDAEKKDIQAFEEMLVSEGPAYEAQFSVLDSDYSIDDIINPSRAKLGHGILALIAKLGHSQKEGWVDIEGVCEFVSQYGCSREDTYELVAQLVRSKILEERQNEDQLLVRMAIPLLRKRYMRQNMYPKYFRTMTKSAPARSSSR